MFVSFGRWGGTCTRVFVCIFWVVRVHLRRVSTTDIACHVGDSSCASGTVSSRSLDREAV